MHASKPSMPKSEKFESSSTNVDVAGLDRALSSGYSKSRNKTLVVKHHDAGNGSGSGGGHISERSFAVEGAGERVEVGGK